MLHNLQGCLIMERELEGKAKAGCQGGRAKHEPLHCSSFGSLFKGSLEHVSSILNVASLCVTVRPILSISAEGTLTFLFLHDLLCKKSLGNTDPQAGRDCDRSQGSLAHRNFSVTLST